VDPRPEHGRFILVVDDFDLIARALVRGLDGRAGFEAIAFTVPKDALAFCETRTPVIALLDIRMPVMDGVTLARHLRTRHLSLPIIFVTGTANDLDVPALRHELGGALRLVHKPYAMATIYEAVDPLLTGYA
jgi:CheY-like chemotaxis protein